MFTVLLLEHSHIRSSLFSGLQIFELTNAPVLNRFHPCTLKFLLKTCRGYRHQSQEEFPRKLIQILTYILHPLTDFGLFLWKPCSPGDWGFGLSILFWKRRLSKASWRIGVKLKGSRFWHTCFSMHSSPFENPGTHSSSPVSWESKIK